MSGIFADVGFEIYLFDWRELFPVVKFEIPTLFSEKVLAILLRPYVRGRDSYDLIWFLSQKAMPNIPYLQSGLKQSRASKLDISSWEDVLEELKRKVNVVSPHRLLKDLRPFIEDSSDFKWIERYKDVFRQPTNK